MKKLIITIDTEGDNLWRWKQGDSITTENTLFLQRFQQLCNEYAFKPVWLTNYEMISDPRYVSFIEKVEATDSGELGMHLHAWNSPPEYSLPLVQAGAPYLIEYPSSIMEEKIAVLTETIRKNTGITPTTHRAGRWAINDLYFQLLEKYGYAADCSVTPHINWDSSAGQSAGAVGSDYSQHPTSPYIVPNTSLLEVPVTILPSHKIFLPQKKSLRSVGGAYYRAFKGQNLWLRPTGRNLKQMLFVADQGLRSESDYVMFMLHSSEFMPGGSPTFPNEQSIDALYSDLRVLFDHVAKNYQGITLRDYAKAHCQGG